VLEGVMRRRTLDDGIPAEALPAESLIPVLRDHGRIPYDAYQPLQAAREVHRRVRHGYAAPDEEVDTAVSTVLRWLPELFPAAAER
jgi:hypothetical protein